MFLHLPTVDFELNRWSPQAHGLVFWAPLLNNNAVDFISGKVATRSAALNVVTSQRGRIFDLTDSPFLYWPKPVGLTGYPLTITAWFDSDIVTTLDVLVGLGTFTATANGFSLVAQGTAAGDPLRAYSDVAGTSANAQTTTGYTAGAWYQGAGVWSATTSRAVYINGGSKGTNATSRVVDFSTIDRLAVGASYVNPAGSQFDGAIMDVRVYRRALTDAEIAAYYKNPWDLFLPTQRWWIVSFQIGDIDGALAASLGALTTSSTGVVGIVGTASPSFNALLVAAAATVPVDGNGAATLGALYLSADGIAPIDGTLALTLTSLDISADGSVANSAAAAITLETLTSDAAGAVGIVGITTITLGALTATGEGYASSDYIGNAEIVLDALTSTADGDAAIIGHMASLLGGVSSVAAGDVFVVGQAALTLGAIGISATAELAVVGESITTLDSLLLTAAGQGFITGQAALSLESVALESVALVATGGGLPTAGASAVGLGSMTLSAAGVVTALIAVYGSVSGVAVRGSVKGT